MNDCILDSVVSFAMLCAELGIIDNKQSIVIIKLWKDTNAVRSYWIRHDVV
jgi:hypothetical protein